MKSAVEMKIEELLKQNGFSHFGMCSLKENHSLEKYKQWLAKGFHADLKFLEEHTPAKENPEVLLANAKTAIVVSQDYFPHPQKAEFPFVSDVTKLPKIAYYAQGEDYHHWFKSRLQNVANQLKETYPQEEFLCFTDSSPVLERDLAYRAGIGWFGKNTCIIHPKKGSFFFIGEIYSTLSQDQIQHSINSIVPDRCGTCTRCIDACPTNALSERELDSNKCISYWTIEAKETPPLELRTKFGPWYFGCDICQLVCPWNQKVFGKDSFGSEEQMGVAGKHNLELNDKENLIKDLRWILNSSNKQIQKAFRATALSRASGNGHKRNALIMIANLDLIELKNDIQKFIEKDSKNKELAQWVLEQFQK